MSTRTDLDLAASIIDDARHAMSPNQRGSRIVPTKRVLWSEDASRIVREWEDRKHRAAALHPRREVHVPSVDLDEATEPPTIRVWACAQCGKREPWGPGWYWYGSLRDLDLTGEPEYVVCSRACRERTATRRKHNPELLDQPTEGEQA